MKHRRAELVYESIFLYFFFFFFFSYLFVLGVYFRIYAPFVLNYIISLLFVLNRNIHNKNGTQFPFRLLFYVIFIFLFFQRSDSYPISEQCDLHHSTSSISLKSCSKLAKLTNYSPKPPWFKIWPIFWSKFTRCFITGNDLLIISCCCSVRPYFSTSLK